MDLSVIIICHQGEQLLPGCLQSLHTATAGLRCELLVVDNGSRDASTRIAAQHGIPCLRLGRNLGFAAAANRGAARATGRHLVFVNTDARPEPGALTLLVRWLDDHRDVALLSGELRYPDGRRQRTAPEYPSRRPLPERPVDVSELRGACLMVRAEAFGALQGFDEGFFFYLEETDLCRRARLAGWRVVLHPGVRVLHEGGATSSRRPARARIERSRSEYRFARKHGGPTARLAALVGGLGACARLAGDGLGVIASLGLSRSLRQRARISAALLAWHLAGLPEGWGLSQHSQADPVSDRTAP